MPAADRRPPLMPQRAGGPAGRAARGALTALAAMIAVTACSGGSGTTTQPADTSAAAGAASTTGSPGAGGSVVLYSGRSKDLVQPLIDRFTSETGTKVEVRYAGTAELAAQLLEEGDRSPADLFWSQDAGALGALAKAGRLNQLPQATLDQVDARYRSSQGTWVGTSGRARVLAYDPRAVPQPQVPTSVFALTDPAWKGKIGIAPTNASFQSFVTAMRVISGEERTQAWLRGLAANQPKIYEGNADVLKAVDAGQVQLGLINHYYWYELAAEKGAGQVNAKLAWLDRADPGSLVNVAGVGILTGAKNKDAAQRLVDYLLAEPAQRYFVSQTNEYPLLAAVPPAKDVPPLTQVSGPAIDLSRLDTLEQTLTMLQQAGLT